MAEELTNDLIDDIIVRLPVKSLLRFRSVSKRLCALIDSNHFVKQHLNNKKIKIKNKNESLIFDNGSNTYSAELYLLDKAVELAQPINPNRPTTRNPVLGCCNGLLCLLNKGVLVIWNPATQKYLKSQVNIDHNVTPTTTYRLVCGFGYDSVSDDYKFVIMFQSLSSSGDYVRSSVTNIYSVRSNSWREIEDFPDDLIIYRQGPGTLACDAIHTIVFSSVSLLVAAFDLVSEEYTVVTLPDFPRDAVSGMMLSELGGALSFVCEHCEIGVVDVWVMKDYGVGESWTKLLTISGPEFVANIACPIALTYSERGDEVLLMVNSEKLVWYDLEKKTFKFVDVHGLPNFFYAAVYFESLVSLDKITENNEEQSGENEGEKEE